MIDIKSEDDGDMSNLDVVDHVHGVGEVVLRPLQDQLGDRPPDTWRR